MNDTHKQSLLDQSNQFKSQLTEVQAQSEKQMKVIQVTAEAARISNEQHIATLTA